MVAAKLANMKVSQKGAADIKGTLILSPISVQRHQWLAPPCLNPLAS
jgi:hypothetical protein